MRTIAWYSCGAASAIMTKMTQCDVVAYCETGSEDKDNARFMRDCEAWFNKDITILESDKYSSTWDVWESKSYISGIKGAPCTTELKIKPRLAFQKKGDVHLFGYTADRRDVERSISLVENYPDLKFSFPLIEAGLTKAACLSLLEKAGITPPRVYNMGFPNANCIPCCKATSPAYWAMVRQHKRKEYKRMVKLSYRLGVRLTRVNGLRAYLHEIPRDQCTSKPIAPDCDLLCQLIELS